MKLGIADTTFARADMFQFVKKAVEDSEESIKLERYTVPGVKDLPVAAKKLLEEHDCATHNPHYNNYCCGNSNCHG